MHHIYSTIRLFRFFSQTMLCNWADSRFFPSYIAPGFPSINKNYYIRHTKGNRRNEKRIPHFSLGNDCYFFYSTWFIPKWRQQRTQLTKLLLSLQHLSLLIFKFYDSCNEDKKRKCISDFFLMWNQQICVEKNMAVF